MDLLVETLRTAGFKARKPRGSFFLYVAAPKSAQSADGKSFDFPTAEAFSQWMITENLISTVPWDDAGAYVRFSVTFAAKDEADEKRVVAEIGRRLSRHTFAW
jgi:LL-diaminopimelate aminotransferase